MKLADVPNPALPARNKSAVFEKEQYCRGSISDLIRCTRSLKYGPCQVSPLYHVPHGCSRYIQGLEYRGDMRGVLTAEERIQVLPGL